MMPACNADVRRTPERRANASAITDLPNDRVSPLFEAAVEAAEEAAINSLFAAVPMDGNTAITSMHFRSTRW